MGTHEAPSGGVLWRTADVQVVPADQRSADAPAVVIALSSEAPVDRQDWDGSTWREVLEHTDAAVDMSRAARGLPFLFDHDARRVAGRVENIRLEADGRLRGDVRFSSAADAQQLARDIADGIRPDISVGYRVMQWAEGRAGSVPEFRAVRWMPLEASSVAIPADITVGVGRAATEPVARPVSAQGPTSPANPAEERSMSVQDNAPAVTVGTNEVERQRADDLLAFAERHGVPMGRARQWVAEGKSVIDALRQLDAERARGEVETPAAKPDTLDLTEREQAQYSIVRAINALVAGKRSGFEFEVSDELGKKLGRSTEGFFMPYSLQVRDLLVGTATKGGNAVYTEYAGFVDLLRARSQVLNLGATLLTGLQGNVQFTTQASAGTFSWEAEGTNAATSSLNLGTITMSPKIGQSATRVSRMLLAQSSPDIEQVVRNDLLAIHAIGLDVAAINGTGTGQPRGVLNTAGIGVNTLGAHGGAPTWDMMVNLETAVAGANADIGTMAYLTTPQVYGRLKRTQKFNTTTGMPLLDGESANGYRVVRSTNVPSNLVQGTSGSNCHAAIFGVWSQLLIGSWGPGAEIMVDPYSNGPAFVKLTSYQLVDVALRYPQAFAADRTILPNA